jgi:hypothetical protein
LPQSEYHAEEGEKWQNDEHPTFLDGAGRLGKRQLMPEWPKTAKFTLTPADGIDYKHRKQNVKPEGRQQLAFSNHLWPKDFDVL